MNKQILTLITVTGTALTWLTACDRKPGISDSSTDAADHTPSKTAALSQALDHFESAATPANEAAVEEAFADLDGKIAKLDGRVATAEGAERAETKSKADDLRTYRIEQKARYAKIKAGVIVENLKPEIRAVGAELKKAAQDVGESVSEIGGKLGEDIRDLGDKAAEKTK